MSGSASCRGRGCINAAAQANIYPESVEGYASKSFARSQGEANPSSMLPDGKTLMRVCLATGRPFIVEVSKPKKRSVDLKRIEQAINDGAIGKVEVSDSISRLKMMCGTSRKARSAKKEYRLLAEFEKDLTEEGLRMVEEKLTGALIKQQTPLRVVHRRADIVRERYIYKLEVKKVTLKRLYYS